MTAADCVELQILEHCHLRYINYNYELLLLLVILMLIYYKATMQNKRKVELVTLYYFPLNHVCLCSRIITLYVIRSSKDRKNKFNE